MSEQFDDASNVDDLDSGSFAESYIGDDLRDIEASYRSKTRCMYIGKEKLSVKLKKKYINTLL